MQAVVSRYHHTNRVEEASLRTLGGSIGGGIPYSNQSHFPSSTLSESLAAFREHHSACASRRRPAYIFEARLEAERTEILAKRYSETLKQELQGTTSCPGLVPNNQTPQPSSLNTSSSSHHRGREVPDNLRSLSSSAAIVTSSVPPPLLSFKSTPGTEGLTISTVPTLAATSFPSSSSSIQASDCKAEIMSQGTICPKLSSFSPSSNNKKPSSLFTEATTGHSTGLMSHDEGPAICNVVVKTEPGLANSDCSSKKATPTTCGGGSTSKEGGTRTGRIRRHSKELLKNLQQAPPTSCSDDASGDGDLSLNPYDIMNGKMCATPLLIPIEETEDETPRTTPTLKSPPVASKRSTKTPPSRGHMAFGSDTILKKELDAFSKVMNFVEKQEKAKELRVTSPFLPPPVPSSLPLTSPYPIGVPPQNTNHHLVSPPPPYSVPSTFPTGPGYLRGHCSNHYNGYVSSPDTPYSLEPRPLQHLPSSTQIGNLLSSPVSSTAPSQPLSNHMSTFDFPSHQPAPPPPSYHHHGNRMFPNQMYPVPHPPHQSSNPLWNGYSPVAGQKRALPHIGGDYATPPPKMSPCPSSMINYPLVPNQLQNPCPQFPPGEAPSFSHLS